MIMQFFKSVLLLALLAGSALAQFTEITYPPPNTTLTVGEQFTVQVYMPDYIQNIDVVAIVIGLAQCYGGTCYNASTLMGNVLYQGPYTRDNPNLYANYTLTVPESFPPGEASLNVINLFMVGASYEPVVEYLNENVTVVAT